MSEDMVERVARAIFQISPDETASRPSLMAADRAIAAMREPTEAMLTAGQEHFAEVDAIIVMHAARQGGSGITWKDGKSPLWLAWRAMIDAAR
jgi:hypothetical protein